MIPGLWELTDYTVNTLGSKGINVIWSYQNSPRIDKPYITLNYSNDDLPDHEWYDDQHIDANGYRTMASWRKAVVDMQFYCGPESMSLANYTAMMLVSDLALNKQMQLNVSIGNRLFLQRVPELLNNSQFEDRAIYQFDFYYTESLQESVGLIETVIVDGSYSGSLTELMCREIISIGEFLTTWDNRTTTWDGNTTLWDFRR